MVFAVNFESTLTPDMGESNSSPVETYKIINIRKLPGKNLYLFVHVYEDEGKSLRAGTSTAITVRIFQESQLKVILVSLVVYLIVEASENK